MARQVTFSTAAVSMVSLNHKIEIMKKLVIVLFAATAMVACDNAADSEARAKDSLDSIATAKKEAIDSTATERMEKIDSTTEQKKEAIDSLESLRTEKDTTDR